MDHFDQFRAQVPTVFGRSLDRAVAELQAQGGPPGEWTVLDRKTAVWGDLLRRRADLCKAFSQRLDDVVQGAELDWPPQSRHALSPEQDMDPLLDMQGHGASALAPVPLASLGLFENPALLSSYRRCLESVKRCEPDDMVRRFERLATPRHGLALAYRLMDEASPDLATLERRMKHLAPALVEELQRLYRRLSGVAQRSDVAALTASTSFDDEVLPALDRLCQPEHAPKPALLKAFLNPAHVGLKAPLPSHFRGLVQTQMEAVTASTRAPGDRTGSANMTAPAGVGSSLDECTWGVWSQPSARTLRLLSLKASAETYEQVVALDVVRALVGRLAAHPLLLRPVGEALVALEPILLRLARDEPRFITQPSHPARRLLDGVLHRAVEYNDASTPAFVDFYRSVLQAFLELHALPEARSPDFLRVLDRLMVTWDASDQALQAQQTQRLQALRLAEQRQAMAQQIAQAWSQLPEMAHAPEGLVSFLRDEWSTVLAWLRLSPPDDGPDAQTCERAVASLLWCVQPAVLAHDADSVHVALPELMLTLRRGLAAIGRPEGPAQERLAALEALCQPPTQPKPAEEEASSQETGPVQGTEPQPTPDVLPVAAVVVEPESIEPKRSVYRPEEPWLDRSELMSAGVEEARPTDFSELGALRPDPTAEVSAVSELNDAAVDEVLAGLTLGAWVDLLSQGTWLRAQLVWSNNTLTLFLFHSAGGRTHSMSRRSCIKLIQDRRLSLVSAAPDVQRAIGSIANTQPANL
ncbi:MAG: DUF1631 family protein [Hydrogenophaga sp.]|uniref:DUF1631 family protein n=1 Tax=Hydrogenophaga sp. TaxID=1904254 RepID=UPI002774E866|nr:DUF1631 family protein [Hydrogenophaga sp.]MDP2416691.1 DUF1631 family protein [Hydrogenophaga sp.]MDZ4189475.1 DUF1631 family protein [Hydrogenophaga sp.]